MSRPKGSKNKVNKPKIEALQSPKSDETKIVDTYIASIKVFGKFYEAHGATITEALTKLKVDGVARGVTVLTVKHGDKIEEKILPKLATIRLFATSPLVREIAIKNTVARFTI